MLEHHEPLIKRVTKMHASSCPGDEKGKGEQMIINRRAAMLLGVFLE
jgi:hypothetical protein